MKKSFILHLLLINVFIFPLHAESMLTKVRDYFYTTRLFAGYHSSPAEKIAAREKLEQLSAERDNLQNVLATTDNEQEQQAIRTKIAEITKQIDQKKIILGQKMTGTRKLFWFVIGSLGLAALELEFRKTQSYIFKYGMPTELQKKLIQFEYSSTSNPRLLEIIQDTYEERKKIRIKYASAPKKLQKLQDALDSKRNYLILEGNRRQLDPNKMMEKKEKK